MAKLETIGERAAWAIDEQCVLNRTKKYEECEKLDMNASLLSMWRCGRADPGAYFLANMARNGYDIFWILTGRKNEQ